MNKPKWLALAKYLVALDPSDMPYAHEVPKILRGFGMIGTENPEVLELAKACDCEKCTCKQRKKEKLE